VSEHHALVGRRVLVVEDDFYLATDTEAALRKAGATIVGPFPSPERVAAALAGGIDCAVVDIELREGPSFEPARMLQNQGVPFVFITAYDRSEIPAEFHAVPHLRKPVRGAALIAAVVSACGR
jgi:CheY-like chemotaxis protein